jgi:hypothetical protein
VNPAFLEKLRVFAETGKLPRKENDEPKAPVHRRF